MQAAIINQTVDFSQIANVTGKSYTGTADYGLHSAQENNTAVRKQSFDDMIKDSGISKTSEDTACTAENPEERRITAGNASETGKKDNISEKSSGDEQTASFQEKKAAVQDVMKNLRNISKDDKSSTKEDWTARPAVEGKQGQTAASILRTVKKNAVAESSGADDSIPAPEGRACKNPGCDEQEKSSGSEHFSDFIPLAAVEMSSADIAAFNQSSADTSDLSSAVFENGEGVKSRRFSLDKDGKIVVSDFRTDESAAGISGEDNAKKDGLKISGIKFDGKNSAEMTVDLSGAQNIQNNVLSANNQTAGADGSNFQAMLSNQIQQNAYEFVKTGNIILKDNDVGQIKLVLNPESLGNVKIDLQISDKNITGRIVVATQEAFNAFRESAESLRQAFISSGFETAGFDLSFAGQNSSSEQFSHDRNDDARFRMTRAYGEFTADSYDDDGYSVENSGFSIKNAVNIVA